MWAFVAFKLAATAIVKFVVQHTQHVNTVLTSQLFEGGQVEMKGKSWCIYETPLFFDRVSRFVFRFELCLFAFTRLTKTAFAKTLFDIVKYLQQTQDME